MSRNLRFLIIKHLSLLVAICAFTLQSKEINLASFEMEPYVGSYLEQEGAIAEIISSAFAESNITINISYFPAARAKSARQKGNYLGVFPVLNNTVSSNYFKLSDPLPGIQLKLLKKKSTDFTQSFDSKKIGVLRGTFIKVAKPKFKNAIFIEANSHEQLLKMLEIGRLDYVFIDKYTASDLMVNKLPYLIGELDFISENSDYLSFHLAFYNNRPDIEKVLTAFNQGLKKIRESGEVDNILYKHGLLEFPDKQDKKTLRIATVNNKELLLLKELSQLYEEQHPNIKLEWRVLDESVLRLRLMSDLTGTAGQFDVMTIGAYETKLWAKKGWLQPIKNLPLEYDLADIIPPIQTSLTYKDSLYALPFYAESSMTYYRKDLFKSAKISMPSQPTWSEIFTLAKRLKQKNNNVYSICLRGKPAWGENVALITSIVNSFGGQWFNHDWQPQLTSKEWYSAVSFYLELMQKYGPPNADTLGYKEILDLFSQGKCAIWVDATVAAGTLFNPKLSTVSDKVGYAKAPKQITDKDSSWLWIWSLAIPISSNSYKEALDFIMWASSKNYITEVALNNDLISIPPGTRHSTYNNKHYHDKAPFSDFVFNEIITATAQAAALKNSPYQEIQYVGIAEFPAIGNFLGKKISKVLSNEKNLIEALSETQAFAEKQMEQSNK